jgi:hypothetical protein
LLVVHSERTNPGRLAELLDPHFGDLIHSGAVTNAVTIYKQKWELLWGQFLKGGLAEEETQGVADIHPHPKRGAKQKLCAYTTYRRRGQFFKQIFAPTEKLAPWQHWVLAQFKPTLCVGASWRQHEF